MLLVGYVGEGGRWGGLRDVLGGDGERSGKTGSV